MLEDTVQTPAIENPPPEEIPAELPIPELPEVITLPEPPVEVEASGSGTDDLDNLLQPSTSTAEEEEKESLEETGSEDVIMNVDESVEVEVAAVEVELTPEVEHLDEVVVNEAEIPEELEISTIATETTEEDGLPALVLPPEAVDVASEMSEPEAAETGLPPVDGDSVEDSEEESNLTDVPPAEEEEVDPEQPAEDADVNLVLTDPEEPVFEEGGMEVKEDTVPEAPAVEEEAPAAPEISTEDLTEDEILLVNQDKLEPPETDDLNSAQPTALSPERESPFTLIADVNLATEGQPDYDIPSLVEVKQNT